MWRHALVMFHLYGLSPQSNVDPRDEVFSYHHQFDDKPSSKSEDRKEYNIGVLRHLQVIFGHLAASRLQYYVPRGFWKQFRYFKDSKSFRLDLHFACLAVADV